MATAVKLALALLTLIAASCAPAPEPTSDANLPERGEPQTFAHPSGLIVEDIRVGDGPLCEPGAVVTLHYTGALADGTVFDSTRPAGDNPGRGRTMTYNLDELMAGLREGIPGMRIGGERRLTIPPELAYGQTGRPPRIPPDAVLVFTIELLDAQAPRDGAAR